MAPIDLRLGQNPFQVIPELSLFDIEDGKFFGFFGLDQFVLAGTHVSWAKPQDTCVSGQDTCALRHNTCVLGQDMMMICRILVFWGGLGYGSGGLGYVSYLKSRPASDNRLLLS